MDQWTVIFVIFSVVVLAMVAQGWSSLLEHNRRKQALEVIKAALGAGKEPPAIVYEQLARSDQAKAPWMEALVFSSLSFGFWLAYFNTEGDQRTAFLIIAATMTLTALACLVFALVRPGRGNNDDAG